MIKRIAILMTLVMLLSVLAGCAGTTVVVGNCTCPTESAADNTLAEAPAAAEGALKTGLAVIAGASVKDAEDAHKLSFDVTVVAVTVDANGVIQECIIDSLNPEVTVDLQGTITSDVAAEILTKNELGDNYNMKLYAGSKYEWYEQAAAVAAFAVGKTADQLKSGVVDENGKAADADLASTATIAIGGYVDAIIKAAETAKDLGAQAGDTLKFAAMPTLKSSSQENAQLQLDCDVVAMTMNGETITSCYIDSLQAKIPFDAEGTITVPETMPTKNELGEGYNMKAWGNAIAEWDVQAAALAAYVTGKTPAEVAGIAVNEKTAPADADLSASVTIAIGGYQALIAKAAK